MTSSEILYEIGSRLQALSFPSIFLCFIFSIISMGFQKQPRFRYGWLKWSLVLLLGGYLLSQSMLIASPESATIAHQNTNPNNTTELSGLSPVPAMRVGIIIITLFNSLLTLLLILFIDAIQFPARGLGRYWQQAARAIFALQLFVERRCREREEKKGEWPDLIEASHK